MDTMMTLKKWEDEFFVQAKKIEEPVVRYVGEAADRVAEYVPARPTFLAQLPTVPELVEHVLKLEKRFVDEQVRFVRSMTKAMEPVYMKFDGAPARPAAKATGKATAK